MARGAARWGESPRIMKQIIQNYRSGKLAIHDLPRPIAGARQVLIQTRASLISVGTERSIVGLGQKGLVGKAMARPDLVKRLLQKVQTEGLKSAFEQAMIRLDTPTPLGYSSAGVVVETGRLVQRFYPGQRVACIGQGFASHAELAAVPEILCSPLPDRVGFDEGAFGMLGIIAMHGVRCSNVTFGGTVGVVGLGLIGLLTVQILRAYGCRVIAMDLDPAKVEIAKRLGIARASTSHESFMADVQALTDGRGLDAVILTLATDSAQPVHDAVTACRARGRIVVVGVADVHPHRNELWAKEVELIVSKGGGPGTVETDYERRGLDYPVEFVRWSQARNHEEFIRLINDRLVDVLSLITHRVPIAEAHAMYETILSGLEPSLVGVVLEYSDAPIVAPAEPAAKAPTPSDRLRIGVLGAGLFGKSVLLPALARVPGATLAAIAASSGPNAEAAGRRFGFARFTTDSSSVLQDPDIDAVVIVTPHSTHQRLICEAFGAGKHVFVEKPLCVNADELKTIRVAHQAAGRLLVVGYNRRFSSLAAKTREHFADRRTPLVINYRVNAGYVPAEHWVHSEEEGGSRVIGEMCHFVDLMQFLTNATPLTVAAQRVGVHGGLVVSKDNLVITLGFSDGSVGSITYASLGDRACPRERVEVFGEGRTAVLDDFRSLELFRNGKRSRTKLSGQSLGYGEELKSFAAAVRGAAAGITAEEAFWSTAAVFAVDTALATGLPQVVVVP